MAGVEHVILMDDSDQGCPAQLHTPVPIPREAESLRTDLDPGTIADDTPNALQGVIT
jgi:hypothetical protein